jgi:hypothetical protein
LLLRASIVCLAITHTAPLWATERVVSAADADAGDGASPGSADATLQAVDSEAERSGDEPPAEKRTTLPRPVRAGLAAAAGAAGALVGGVAIGAPLGVSAAYVLVSYCGGASVICSVPPWASFLAGGLFLSVPAGAGIGAWIGSWVGLAPFLDPLHALGVAVLTGIVVSSAATAPIMIVAFLDPYGPVGPAYVPLLLASYVAVPVLGLATPILGAVCFLPEDGE